MKRHLHPSTRHAGRVAALLLGTALSAAPAMAQQFDYDSLNELFGEPVTTSAIGKPQRVSDAPSTMQIITADEIKRSGAYSIPQLLERVVGVDVLNVNIAYQAVGIRGFARPFATQTLIMVNGRPLFGEVLFEVEWNNIPIEMADIQQIEVVKGPATALFGFNAFRGVINIITRDALLSPVNSASVRFGNHGFQEYSLVKTLALGPTVAARISAGFSRSNQFFAKELPGPNPYQKPIDDALNSREASRRSVAGDLVWNIDDKSNLRVEGSYIAGKQGSAWSTWSNVYTESKIWAARASYTVDSDWGLINVNGYSNNLKQMWTPNFSGYPVRADNKVHAVRLEDLVKAGADHTFRLSAEYRRSKVGGTPGGDIFGQDGSSVNKETFAGGLVWDWAATPTLTFTNSARVDFTDQWRVGLSVPSAQPYVTNDDYKRNITTPSFNSYVTWKPTEQDTLRATIGYARQLAPACEAACQTDGGIVLYMGDPNLPLTTIEAYELAYDRTLESINGRFRSAIWYQHTYNNIATGTVPLDFTSMPLVFPFVNTGMSNAKGLELELQGLAAGFLRWQVDYAYIDVTDHPTTRMIGGYPVLHHNLLYGKTTSKHKFGGLLGITQGKWDADVSARTYSGRNGFAGSTTYLVPVPSYVNVSARVGYRLNDTFTISAEGWNLLDRNHIETNGIRMGSRYSVGVQAKF